MENRMKLIEQIIKKNCEESKSVLYISNKMLSVPNCKVCSTENVKQLSEDDISQYSTIVLDDFSENNDEAVFLLNTFRKLMKEQEIHILIVAENASREDRLLGYFSGSRMFDSTNMVMEKTLRDLMKSLGYHECGNYDLEYEKKSDDYNTFLATGTMVNKYLTWVQDFIGNCSNVDCFIREYSVSDEVKEEQNSDHDLFLSIITRTQGKRPEALRETLLCLAGQQCKDFEVLIMGHKLDEKQENVVRDIIEATPFFLRNQIRYIPVLDGNRTTPINRGFEEAKGRYAVILDDDDLVLDHWVSSFKEKETTCAGQILHAYVVAQDWSMIETASGDLALRACGSPQTQYCKKFNQITELNGNYCPVLGLAFPMYPFRELGLRFDETLDTTEDWDYLMRVSSICGVADIEYPTSIYRLWRNTENSYSLHDKEIWVENHEKIQKKFMDNPFMLSKEYMKNFISVAEQNSDLFDDELIKNEYGQNTTMYFHKGGGYTEADSVSTSTKIALPDFKYEFSGLESKGEIACFRWDPYDRGGIMIDSLQITITLKNGKKIIKTNNQVSSNGFHSRGNIIILHSDPQIYVKLAKKELISDVVITGHIFKRVPDSEYEYIAAIYDPNLIQKSKKRGKIVVKKVIGKVKSLKK